MKRLTIRAVAAKPFDEHRRALGHRASSAAVAVAVDARPRAVAARKGRGSYDRRRIDAGRDD